MPARSKIETTLPDDVRAELDRRLVASAFADYSGLSLWLEAQGFEISRSSLHRYGQGFELRLAALRVATEQAKAITEAMGDDAGALGEALTAVAQEKAFQVLMNFDPAEAEVDLPKLTKSIADLNKTGVLQKKWAQDVRARAASAADAAEAIATKGGLSDEAAAQIRAQILGIAK